MRWTGWLWDGGGWTPVCKGASPSEVRKKLDAGWPVKNNLRHGITTGAVPAWVPGDGSKPVGY